MSANNVLAGDTAALNGDSIQPSTTAAAEAKPAETSGPATNGNGVPKPASTAPAAPSAPNGTDAIKPAAEPSVESKDPAPNGTSNPKPEAAAEATSEATREAPPTDITITEAPKEPAVEAPKPVKEPAVEAPKPDQDEPQTGDKRKAENQPATTLNGATDTPAPEAETKKQKLTTNVNDTSADPGINVPKKGPGRPKGSGEGKTKKEKKAPVVGRSERRTRSQGAL